MKKRAKKEILFNQLIEEWKKQKIKKVKASTFSIYTHILEKHIIPELSDIVISQKIVDNFIERKKKAGLKPSTINNVCIVLNSILSLGYDNIKCEKQRRPKTKTRILTEYEKLRLENYLLDNLNFFNFGLLLMMYTGLRVGELSALLISDINAQAQIVSITKTLERIRATDNLKGAKTKIIIDTPKSQSSVREIALIDFIIELYQKIYKGHTTGYLLTGTSRYIEPHSIDRKFKKILQDCNIQSINIHALRHTFATEFYKETKDVKTLSEILGHSSENTTISLYIHSDLNEQKRGIEKMSKNKKTA